jgi:formylglycine-generating enzyme required for sulfatase activity
VRAFLSLYPNSKFENEARELLAALEPAKPPEINTSPVRPSPYRAASFTTAKVVNGRIEKSQSQCDLFVEDLGAGVTIELARIPAGRFQMGSPASEQGRYDNEGPQHEVRVGEFLLGRYEVTQRQWRAVAALPKVNLDLKADPSNFKGDDLPVENVSWEEVKEFIGRLNRKLGLTEQTGYRLPSEAEWEYAARAGTTTRYAFGDEFSSSLINNNGSKTVAVGSLGVANAWGLFDMHGNVWEWCEDDWHDSYNGAPADGRPWVDSPSRGSGRVDRGGGWVSLAVNCRSAFRYHGAPGDRYVYLGFRLLRTYR